MVRKNRKGVSFEDVCSCKICPLTQTVGLLDAISLCRPALCIPVWAANSRKAFALTLQFISASVSMREHVSLRAIVATVHRREKYRMQRNIVYYEKVRNGFSFSVTLHVAANCLRSWFVKSEHCILKLWRDLSAHFYYKRKRRLLQSVAWWSAYIGIHILNGKIVTDFKFIKKNLSFHSYLKEILKSRIVIEVSQFLISSIFSYSNDKFYF